MNRRITLDLNLSVNLDCEYELNGRAVDAVAHRAPDRCFPAGGGAVTHLRYVMNSVRIEGAAHHEFALRIALQDVLDG